MFQFKVFCSFNIENLNIMEIFYLIYRFTFFIACNFTAILRSIFKSSLDHSICRSYLQNSMKTYAWNVIILITS